MMELIITVYQNWFANFASLHFAKVSDFGKVDTLIISYFFQYIVGTICKSSSKNKSIYSQFIFV